MRRVTAKLKNSLETANVWLVRQGGIESYVAASCGIESYEAASWGIESYEAASCGIERRKYLVPDTSSKPADHDTA